MTLNDWSTVIQLANGSINVEPLPLEYPYTLTEEIFSYDPLSDTIVASKA